MSQTKFELKDVTVSFSTMLNKPEKAKYGRGFKILVPIDSPVLENVKKNYNELNELAKVKFGESLGKKLKNAKSDIFEESVYHEGFVEIPFNIFSMNEVEVETEDGKKIKQYKERINMIYEKSPMVCYFLDNNGGKMTETENGKKIYPLSQNIINIQFSLVAGYNKKENRPSIYFKAEDVEIVKSEWGNKNNGPKIGLLTLGGEEEEIATKVESTKVEEDEMFTADDISELDIANV